jgi:hypothetical protein
MGNKKEFYNADLKNKFLETTGTQRTNISRLFKKSFKFEEQHNQDLSEMPKELLIQFISEFTYEVAKVYLSYLKKYRESVSGRKYDIIIKEITQYRKDNDNPFDRDIIKGLLTREFFYDLVSRTKHKQNALFNLLAFEGIGTESSNNETDRLQCKDFNSNTNSIYIASRDSYVIVPSKLIQFVKNAHAENYVWSYDIRGGDHRGDIVRTEYIVHKLKNSAIKDINSPIEDKTRNSRIAYFNYEFKKELNNCKFNVSEAKMSGIFYYVACFTNDGSDISDVNLLKILKRYKISLDKKYDILKGLPYYKREILKNKPIVIDSETQKIIDSIKDTELTQADILKLQRKPNKTIKDKDEDDFDNIIEKKDRHKSGWVSGKVEEGFKGEKYIFDLLKERLGKGNVKNPSDSYGYDIALRNPKLYLEVKTTNRYNPGFVISSNELNKAEKLSKSYYIVLVMEDNYQAYVIDINTPDFDNCFEYINSSKQVKDNITFRCNSVKVKLNSSALNNYEDFEKFFSKF